MECHKDHESSLSHCAGMRQRAMALTGTSSLLLFFQSQRQPSSAGRDSVSTISGTVPTLAAHPPDKRMPPVGQLTEVPACPLLSVTGGNVNIRSISCARPARGASARGHSQDASALEGDPSSHARMRTRLEIDPAAKAARCFIGKMSPLLKEGSTLLTKTRYLTVQQQGAH